tara:strand:+ start:104 stop:340 length:237 start_codon:yes stop_codon:yes gene_type:complete
MTKRKFSIEEHREFVVATLAGLKESSNSTKSDIRDIKSLLREQNSRINKNEKSIARIFGMGSVVFGVFSALFTWLFKK